MARKCFFSFHYKPDAWRASQVRNIGVVEGNEPASDNDWETVTSRGDEAIKKWIADQMRGRTCTVVLVGTETAGRKWIDHEIIKSWNDGLGVVGIRVHGLKDQNRSTSVRGQNPFAHINYGIGGTKLSTIVKCYDPPGATSTDCYDWISKNIEAAIDEAITIRKNN